MLTATATRISLEVGHGAACDEFAGPLFLQLSRGAYDRCSVMEIPASIEEWRDAHRTARKRADRASRLGYRAEEIDRAAFNDDIFAINTSLDIRQNRRMSEGYQRPQVFGPLPDYVCDHHAVRTYGVLHGERLVAYLWLYRAGGLALVSSILGHGDHLANDVMYLLFEGAVQREVEVGGGVFVYNRWDSGTDGLRYFKSKLGFSEAEVEWLP